MRDAATAPNPVAVVLRPFGYLLIGLVWTALVVVVVGISGALLFGFASTGGGEAPWSDLDVPGWFAVCCIGLLWVVLVGFLEVLLPLATAPLAVLSFTYVVRALRPAFREQRLSYTVQGRETIGPVTVSGTVAMSLLPVQRSRWTDFWMRLYAAGWSGGGGRVWVASMPWGLATFLLPVWVLSPIGPTAAAVWTVLTIAAGVATVVLTWRALTRPPARPTVGGPVRAALEGITQRIIFGPSSSSRELRKARRAREKRRQAREKQRRAR